MADPKRDPSHDQAPERYHEKQQSKQGDKPPKKPPELSKEMPPMVLEQDPSGLWMYHRDAWLGGPPVQKNGVSPGITTREDAARVVNLSFPGAFPEEETMSKEKWERMNDPNRFRPQQPNQTRDRDSERDNLRDRDMQVGEPTARQRGQAPPATSHDPNLTPREPNPAYRDPQGLGPTDPRLRT